MAAADGRTGHCASGSGQGVASTNSDPLAVKRIMVVDTRNEFSENDPKMQELFHANLMPEERESVVVVVCISKTSLKGVPSKNHAWTKVKLTSRAEGRGRLVLFYKRDALQENMHVNVREHTRDRGKGTCNKSWS